MVNPRVPRPPLGIVGPGRVHPDPVRWDRVRNARSRIAAGWYDRPEVLERLAEAVLTEIEHD